MIKSLQNPSICLRLGSTGSYHSWALGHLHVATAEIQRGCCSPWLHPVLYTEYSFIGPEVRNRIMLSQKTNDYL